MQTDLLLIFTVYGVRPYCNFLNNMMLIPMRVSLRPRQQQKPVPLGAAGNPALPITQPSRPAEGKPRRKGRYNGEFYLPA